ncbi:MAG: hypothetical protein WAT66_12365 [Actinomycetota bacterium]
MTREAALVTSWSQPARGREGKALEAFTDYLTFWAKQATEGKVSEVEPYFTLDGRSGMGIVKGPSDALQEVLESEEFEKLITKAQLTVDDLRVEMYVTGDEIQRAIRIYGEAAGELGYL